MFPVQIICAKRDAFFRATTVVESIQSFDEGLRTPKSIVIEQIVAARNRFLVKWSSRNDGFLWTDCIIDKIFKNIEIVKFITTALKSILKLVKWQSLVAKCCKMQKI